MNTENIIRIFAGSVILASLALGPTPARCSTAATGFGWPRS